MAQRCSRWCRRAIAGTPPRPRKGFALRKTENRWDEKLQIKQVLNTVTCIRYVFVFNIRFLFVMSDDPSK